MPNLSANLTYLFTEWPLLDRIGQAASLGFRAVEVLAPYAVAATEMSAALRANGVELALINLPFGDERGSAARPGDEALFREHLDAALRYAVACGCTRVHAMSGLRLAGVPLATHEDVLCANLTYAAERCAAAGVTVTIEPLNANDNPGYVLQSTGQGIAILDRVARPNVMLQFDGYHVFHTEGRVAERAHELRGRFAHVQIAGCPDRHEPDSGELDIAQVFAQLDADGYAGWIGLEYKPRTTTLAGIGWAAPYLR
jgi:hydroxypyruvate isomerase